MSTSRIAAWKRDTDPFSPSQRQRELSLWLFWRDESQLPEKVELVA
jgi:hypothetical protein